VIKSIGPKGGGARGGEEGVGGGAGVGGGVECSILIILWFYCGHFFLIVVALVLV
jgi:hypothetical protein